MRAYGAVVSKAWKVSYRVLEGVNMIQLFAKQQFFGLDEILSICRQKIKCCYTYDSFL